MRAPPRLVVLSGATATGKTALAVELACVLDAEIISADSVQVYDRLVIGSARPSPAELAAVQHHLVGHVSLDEHYDAARFTLDADRAIEEVTSRGRNVLVVGGAGLYLRALVKGLATGIPSEPAVREALQARAAEGPETLRAMHVELSQVDPDYARGIHPTDPTRIVRALEVWHTTGVAYSEHHRRQRLEAPRYQSLWLALEVPREELRRRIAERVKVMLAQGLIDEVKDILDDGFPPTLRPLRSVGYAEVVDALTGQRPLDRLADAITLSTGAFAKRQRTWFRGEPGVCWLSPSEARESALRDTLGRWFAFAEQS